MIAILCVSDIRERSLASLLTLSPVFCSPLLQLSAVFTTNLEPSLMYLLRELVDSSVAGCTDEDRAIRLLGELVHQAGGGDSLASAGRALDQRQRPLQRVLQRKLLPQHKRDAVSDVSEIITSNNNNSPSIQPTTTTTTSF